jgi:hypothetical protein
MLRARPNRSSCAYDESSAAHTTEVITVVGAVGYYIWGGRDSDRAR